MDKEVGSVSEYLTKHGISRRGHERQEYGYGDSEDYARLEFMGALVLTLLIGIPVAILVVWDATHSGLNMNHLLFIGMAMLLVCITIGYGWKWSNLQSESNAQRWSCESKE